MGVLIFLGVFFAGGAMVVYTIKFLFWVCDKLIKNEKKRCVIKVRDYMDKYYVIKSE